MASNMNIQEANKRTLDALERRFAQAKAEVHQQDRTGRKSFGNKEAATGNNSPSSAVVPNEPPSITPRKGHFSFSGVAFSKDTQANDPTYFALSQPMDTNLATTACETSSRRTTIDLILDDLLQRGDSAQKYIQGSRNVKIDNWILLDNFVPKGRISSTDHMRALQRYSKRSRKHMSLKQHKKFGSFDLPQQYHRKNQLAQCLLNADLHGAVIIVVQCKVSNLTGARGIMIRETAETFGIITERNKFHVVPKRFSVFMLQADRWKITLVGDKLVSRNMIS